MRNTLKNKYYYSQMSKNCGFSLKCGGYMLEWVCLQGEPRLLNKYNFSIFLMILMC
jgi:hypothetical protein